MKRVVKAIIIILLAGSLFRQDFAFAEAFFEKDSKTRRKGYGERVPGDITAKLDNVKSYSAGYKRIKKGEPDIGGWFKYKKPDKMKRVTYPGENPEKTGRYIIIIDGGDKWNIIEKAKVATKVKSHLPASALHRYLSFVCNYSEGDKMKHARDESIDGTDCYVLDITPYNYGGGRGGPQKVYVQKDTGLVKKVITLDRNGKEVSYEIFENYQLNIPIDDSEFTYVPAEDVIVSDMTPGKVKSLEELKKEREEISDRINRLINPDR